MAVAVWQHSPITIGILPAQLMGRSRTGNTCSYAALVAHALSMATAVPCPYVRLSWARCRGAAAACWLALAWAMTAGCVRAQATTWEDFMAALGRKHMVLAPWADEEAVEEDVKKRSVTPDAAGAKTLCLPFDQPALAPGTLCFASGKPAKNWALWGRSY
jgi:hypothetical protein